MKRGTAIWIFLFGVALLVWFFLGLTGEIRGLAVHFGLIFGVVGVALILFVILMFSNGLILDSQGKNAWDRGWTKK